MATSVERPTLVGNFIGGEWQRDGHANLLDVIDPATNTRIAQVPDSTAADVQAAVAAASKAFPGWRETPPQERIQYLFKLKTLLESHLEELAAIITQENGKTLVEARPELR